MSRRALLTVTLLATTVGILACGTPPVRALDDLAVVDSLYVDPETRAPYTGPVVRHFDDAPEAVQIRGALRDGTWDGELVVYHPNGRVRYMGSFEGGNRCGPWVENADSTPTLSVYEDLVREVESMGLYPPCEGG